MTLETWLKNKELLNNLKIGSCIVYGFAYHSPGIIDMIEVSSIIELKKSVVKVQVPFAYSGYLSEVPYQRILAIGDNKDGQAEIPGFMGKYHILHPTKLKAILKISRKI